MMTLDRNVTLREGLRRFNAENHAVLSDQEVPENVLDFFRCHDTAHVVFGCDTSIFGEGMLKIFTIFGTTLGFWKHISAYGQANAFSLFRQYSVLHVLQNIFGVVINMPRVILRAKRMNKRWPWSDHERYLDMPVVDIRREFNIQIITGTKR